MTPDVQAAAERLTAFLDAQDRKVIGSMPVATTRTADGTTLDLERDDLRTLLAALDRTEAELAALRFLLADPDPAEQPIDHIPTRHGINYLARRQQHPRDRP